jgi:hypothetical protein
VFPSQDQNQFIFAPRPTVFSHSLVSFPNGVIVKRTSHQAMAAEREASLVQQGRPAEPRPDHGRLIE